MQLTRHTDFAVRLLMQLASSDAGRVTIAQVADTQAVPLNHLTKIANDLARSGFIEATRGRGGGIRLARAAEDIRMGDVIAAMEPHCMMVNCDECRLLRQCSLPRQLKRALDAFYAVLNEQSLADIAKPASAAA